MQLQTERQSSYHDIRLEPRDLEKMRKAFTGIHVPPRRAVYYRIHLEAGQAYMTDGARLHTIPVRYRSPVGVDVDLDEVKRAWTHPEPIRLRPTYPMDSFLHWDELMPKADIGVLCDVDVWMPTLESIRGWGWSTFAFFREETVIQPVSDHGNTMQVGLSHLMYKGKKVMQIQERVFNPQFIYDVFRNATGLGDSRVFLCLVSQNLGAPLLCRGNNSSLLALILPRK